MSRSEVARLGGLKSQVARSPECKSEIARRGAMASNALRTPEERKRIASLGHLAASVSAVVRRFRELTPEQLEQLKGILALEGENS